MVVICTKNEPPYIVFISHYSIFHKPSPPPTSKKISSRLISPMKTRQPVPVTNRRRQISKQRWKISSVGFSTFENCRAISAANLIPYTSRWKFGVLPSRLKAKACFLPSRRGETEREKKKCIAAYISIRAVAGSLLFPVGEISRSPSDVLQRC